MYSRIYVEDINIVKKIIAELEKGGDFKALAKKHSIDPMGSEGGDLGWFTADRMVPPFSEAVVALENGKYSKQPVQTQFGWHVILREDSRALTPPPLDAVKEQIRPMLQRQKAQTMIESLRKNAKVEVLLPPETKPAEAQPSSATPADSTATPATETAPANAEGTTSPAAVEQQQQVAPAATAQ